MRTDPPKKSPGKRGKNVFTEPVVSIILSILLTIALKLLVEKAWSDLTGLWNRWWFTAIATLVVLLSGGALFLFRRRFQAMYGLSEIGVAIFVIWTSLVRAQTTGDAASVIAIIGGAYLIVRGATNYDEGKKKRLLKKGSEV
ncbi:MAG TPA: hypothetical protein VJ751_03610 [Pyrinomonadaceae bacterium]|jgi:hypothetical protein|nr:hypothetical protein [Pyrinomonadaceae bacterium]